MKVEMPFPLPEHEPVVPDKLAEFVTNYLSGTTKIHVLVYTKGGWSKANGIIIEDGDDPSEVYSRTKACADYHHTEHGGEHRKYRALMWRKNEDGRSERRTLSFEVFGDALDDSPESSGEVETLRKQADGWQALCEDMRKMTSMALDFGNRSVDRVLEQARIDSDRVKPLTELTREMLGQYREGLRMQAAAVKEIGEMRAEHEMAQAGGADSKHFWDTMGPAIQVAVAQAGQKFLGGEAPTRALPPRPKKAPKAKATRKEFSASDTSDPQSQANATERLPDSLVELVQLMLDGLGAQTVLRLSRAFDDEQSQHLEDLSSAIDEDTAARSLLDLTESLKASPAGLVKMQSLLTVPQITAFRQLAALAAHHVREQVPTVKQVDSRNDDAAAE